LAQALRAQEREAIRCRFPALALALICDVAATPVPLNEDALAAMGGSDFILPTVTKALPARPTVSPERSTASLRDNSRKQKQKSPGSPRQLVQQRKKSPVRIGLDAFVLWEKAARPTQPVSAWRTDRNIMREKDHPGGFIDGSTLLSTIVGPARFAPAVPPEDDSRSRMRPTAFEGMWTSRADGDLRGRIEGSFLTWVDDGSRTRFKVIKKHSRGGSGDVITMMVDGESHSGVLSEDGHILRWGDGDRWLRLDESFDRLQMYCEDSSGTQEDVQHQGWVVTDRCVMSNHLKSLARPSSSSASSPTSRPAPRHHANFANHENPCRQLSPRSPSVDASRLRPCSSGG